MYERVVYAVMPLVTEKIIKIGKVEISEEFFMIS